MSKGIRFTNELETLFYQIILFGPKSTNGRHFLQKKIFYWVKKFLYWSP